MPINSATRTNAGFGGTQSLLGRDRSRGDLSAPLRHIDPILLVCSLALAALGVLMVYSTTREEAGVSFLMRQGAFVGIGAGVMVVTALVDYHRIRDWAWALYGAAMVLLVLVLSPLGVERGGAQAWFDLGPVSMQPSEFTKFAVIVLLGALLAEWWGELDLRRLGIVLLVAGAPMGLIMLQPDLGTVLVIVSIVLGMLLVGGLRGRYILALSIFGLVGVVIALNSGVLKQYQVDRLTTFLESDSTPVEGATRAQLDARLNVDQSKITIANGRVTGMGLFEGPQTQRDFVPEQETDFIFTAVGEELGFMGAATVLGLYAVIMWRIWRIAGLSLDELGTLYAAGVLAMFTFQVFENVGMTMGIMPVTGIPLPLFSYGGTSVIATFAALGLVMNVHMRRFR